MPRQTHPEDRPPRRRTLGVYVDAVYGRPAGPGHGTLTTEPVDYAFLLFAAAVAERFSGLALAGRTLDGEPPPDHVALPFEAALVPLPHYPGLQHLRALAGALPGTLRALWRLLDRSDVVWAFGPHPFALALAVLGVARGRRVVLGVRQDTVAYLESRAGPGRRRTIRLAARLLDGSFRTLARRLPTTAVGEDLARRYEPGRAPVLPFVVSLVRAGQVADAPASSGGSGPFRLLTAGRIEPEKDPLLLVEALARLEEARPGGFRLTWLGRGTLERAVADRALELGVLDRIDFRGYVPFGDELLDLYRQADAFVLTSVTEGVPQVVVEAMASGLPVVATDVGGLRRTLQDGAAGLLVPSGDAVAAAAAVLRLAESEELRSSLAGRALEVARGQTLELEARRVSEFLAG